MKPIEFPGHNVVFAKDQPEYQPLPALLVPGVEGEVISCWQLTDEEIERLRETKCIYISQLCFTKITEDGFLVNNPLQPILPMVELGDNILLI